MKILIDEFNTKSNIAIVLDPVISFNNINEAYLKLTNAKKQIRELEKILSIIYDEYTLSFERDDTLIQGVLQPHNEMKLNIGWKYIWERFT